MPEQPPAMPNLLELPAEVTAGTILRVGVVGTLEGAQLVCTSWRSICKDPSMWRTIEMSVPWYLLAMGHGLEVTCRRAIDLSRGGCVDVSIKFFGTDEVLKRITDRCNHIRRLRLVLCRGFSNEGLSETAKKLPLLEDLELWLHTTISWRMP